MKRTATFLTVVSILTCFISTTYAQIGGSPAPISDARVSLANAVSEIQELKHQFQALRATIESNSHLIRSQTDGVNLKLNDMDARIGSLEERLKIQGRQVTSAISTVAPEIAAEAELYQAALNQVNASEFLKAIATFKKFKQKFPKSQYVSNSQYWIGECYFAMRDFEMAIKEFQNMIDSYRRSEKIPAAMLKQGYAFNELGMETDAKVFLKTLIKKYPRTKEAKRAEAWLKREKNLKEQAASQPSRVHGGIPLAPGVETPEDKKKKSSNPSGKYN